MSLFGAIRMASGTLRANEIGLQVVGQNIANANTPGYIREVPQFTPATSQKVGDLQLGMGVLVSGVVEEVDNFLEERLRGAVSDQNNTQTQANTYKQLEPMLGSLSSSGTGSMLTGFFSSVSAILNQPEDTATRNLAVLQGSTLAQNINQLASQVSGMRSDLNNRVMDMATEINRLTDQVAKLNVQIAAVQGGDQSKSDAVGLQDQRLQALSDLSKLVNVRVQQQPSGAVNVYCGGNYLVYEASSHPVDVVLDNNRGMATADIHLVDGDTSLNPASGELRGLLDTRDKVLGGFQDQLDAFSKTLAFEFNKAYSSGQGLSGFQNLTSQFAVDSSTASLDAAGLKFTPGNGSFQILVHNTQTGQSKTTEIPVDLSGTGKNTTLQDLADALNKVDGIAATITSAGQLNIQSTSADGEFAFAHDTSGVLAALGLNTFFTGSTAEDLGVSQVLKDDPAKFAASSGGIGADTQNAVALANLADQSLPSHNGATLSGLFDQLTGNVTQNSSVAQAQADSATAFVNTLQSQEQSISGVSIDEEAVNMLAYQRAYQAAAKFISTLNDLFGVLVQL